MNYGLCKMRPCGNTTLYKYAHAVNGGDLAATDRNYKNDSDEEKAWNYRCSSLNELSADIFRHADISFLPTAPYYAGKTRENCSD